MAAPDISELANSGIVKGAQYSDGVLQFDGIDDSVEIPAQPQYQSRTSLTVMAWVKPESNYFSPIVTMDTGSSPAFQISVTRGTSSLGKDGLSQDGYRARVYTSKGHNIPVFFRRPGWGDATSEWEHIAMTFENVGSTGHLRLYVNGEEVGSNLDAGSNLIYKTFGTDRMYLGANPGDKYDLSGSIGSVQLSTAALTPEEIAGVFSSESGKWLAESEAVAVLELNESPIGSVPDLELLGDHESESKDLGLAALTVSDPILGQPK